MDKRELDYIKYHGKIGKEEPSVLPEITVSRDDRARATITVVNKWNVIEGSILLYPGDPINAATLGISEGDDISDLSHWFVTSVSKRRIDGYVGELTLNAVYAPKGKQNPYSVTYTIEMREVQKAIETHPLLNGSPATDETRLFQKQIRKWNLSPEAARTKWDKDNKPTFYYFDFDERGDAMAKPLKVESPGALKYCAAKTAGIDNFNLYLPVIKRVSQYVQPKGVEIDEETHEIKSGSTFEIFDEDEMPGQFCAPPVKIKGFTDEAKFKWFKSMGDWQMNADTTWTLTEEWVCTNDLNHTWIYSGTLDDDGEAK